MTPAPDASTRESHPESVGYDWHPYHEAGSQVVREWSAAGGTSGGIALGIRIAKAITAAVLAERDRCAKVAETTCADPVSGQVIAERIRGADR